MSTTTPNDEADMPGGSDNEEPLHVTADLETGGPSVWIRSRDNSIRITGIGSWEPDGRINVTLCDRKDEFHQESVLQDGQWQGQPWLDASMKAAILERAGFEKKDWPDVQHGLNQIGGNIKAQLDETLG